MDKIDFAFKNTDRKMFVSPDLIGSANLDIPLPIGYGQTISQPSTVRAMLNWLDLKDGQKVLDVGSGSGWTTALISKIIGEDGEIYAVEKVPELLAFGRKNCKIAGVKNANFFLASQTYGHPTGAPYDRILVSASAKKLPKDLLDQLKVGGKIVIPVGNDIFEISKISPIKYNKVIHPGFIFVPLI